MVMSVSGGVMADVALSAKGGKTATFNDKVPHKCEITGSGVAQFGGTIVFTVKKNGIANGAATATTKMEVVGDGMTKDKVTVRIDNHQSDATTIAANGVVTDFALSAGGEEGKLSVSADWKDEASKVAGVAVQSIVTVEATCK